MAGVDIQMDDFGRTDTAPLLPTTDNIPLDNLTPPEATGGGEVVETSFGGDNMEIDTYGNPINFPDTPMGEPGMRAGDNLGNLREILNGGTIEDARKLLVNELFKTFKIQYGFDPPPPPQNSPMTNS